MTQVFIDTIIICSITGITLVMGDLYHGDLRGAELTTATFELLIGSVGPYIVAIGLVFFAYSTVLGWAYYGEKCFSYLFGINAIKYYRIVYVLAVFVGAVSTLDVVWGIADIMNGLMAFPNLIGLLGLSGVVVAETRRFRQTMLEEKNNAANLKG